MILISVPVDEQDDKPLKVEGVDVVSLPFYKLSTKFGDLDQSKPAAMVRTRRNESPAGALSARAGVCQCEGVCIARNSFCRVVAMSYPAYRFISAPTSGNAPSFIISSSVMATSTMVSAAPSAIFPRSHRLKIATGSASSSPAWIKSSSSRPPTESDKLSASADTIHGITTATSRDADDVPWRCPQTRRDVSISAEIRASPVDTLLKVKAEISTKCAVSTIHRVPSAFVMAPR